MATEQQVQDIYTYVVGLYKAAPGGFLQSLEDVVDAGTSTTDLALSLADSTSFTGLTGAYSDAATDELFVTTFLTNLVGSSVSDATFATGETYLLDLLAGGASRAEVAVAAIDAIAAVPSDHAEWGAARDLLDSRVADAVTYSTDALSWNDADGDGVVEPSTNIAALQNVIEAAGTTFNLTSVLVSAPDTNAMRITGDQAVRIDFTNAANQITGLDYNGDGNIANDGVENNVTDQQSGFDVVDAYARNPLNESDSMLNFLGDIDFDGTGVDGDGVSTDGNIFLGGLGADTARAGIGNDFLAGGGVAGAGTDWMYGGRNADFFFASLSDLSTTDGDSLRIDGGETTDDSAIGDTAMDSDWLLLEVADDEDGTVVNLTTDGTSTNNANTQFVISGNSGSVINMNEIEHVDASGNLYGFLDNIDVALGEHGMMVDGENVGIGATSQLRITGSGVNNIFLGGFDNDLIDGAAGNDLLFGGNMDYNNNPNTTGIVNDGRDELRGGAGDDDIVFEADGGRIEGDSLNDQFATLADPAGNDTLWLTHNALGTQTAADMTTDGVIRFDLDAQNIDAASGYGGADFGTRNGTADDTQDQTNYKTGVDRTTVQDMENVITTGLGAVDYDVDGSNAGDMNHTTQMNFNGYEGDLTLRGTAGANILYANTGNDDLEGRAGNDSLSGGLGDDDFIFAMQNSQLVGVAGDGVDTIHRQADVDGDGFWDNYGADITAPRLGDFVQDFGQISSPIASDSKLTLSLVDAANPADLTGFPVDGIKFSLDGTDYTVALTTGVQGTYADFRDGLNLALDADPALAGLNAVLNADNTITITDPAGGTFVSIGYTFIDDVVPPAGDLVWDQAVGGPTLSLSQDRLIYASYEDRADGERVDDDAVTGSSISLGQDAYAQDLVIDFAADGTRIAEDQAYTLTFDNLTTEDTMTIAVNGVTYSLKVGVDIDGNAIAGEELLTQGGTAATQAVIQTAFLARMAGFINTFMDNDTAVGQVNAAATATTLVLNQVDYNAEETVFMQTPSVTLINGSTGETPTVEVTNTSQHQVHLFDFDGRDANLNAANVLFEGNTGVSRAVLATADNDASGTLTGSDAVIIDGGANDLEATVRETGAAIADNSATNSNLATNFTVHGDDLLIGGGKAADATIVDTINAGTGDDRVLGSYGNDIVDGGKSYYAVQVLGEAQARVYVLNQWEASNPTQVTALSGLTISAINRIADSQVDGAGFAAGVGTGEVYNDTLQFQQADFTQGDTRFTVTLDNFNTTAAGVVELQDGGAGTVGVDNEGDGTIDSTTTFTNFENIRTVSGVGTAVAGANGGQGNDTLNVTALSTATGGINYDMTNNADVAGSAIGAGKVSYSADAHADAGGIARPVVGDFESQVIKVDGVESVVAGLGDDLVQIDETEAAKDNSFSASLGADRIDYQNTFSGVAVTDAVAQPVVTINVNSAADQDTVQMTSGRVGSVVATDTLTAVEYITLSNGTATSSKEADVLNVTAMATGAVVDYTTGEVSDLGGNVQVTVEGIANVENVWADGNDTVIVADATIMGTNAREDVTDVRGATPSADLALATFIDYDQLVNPNVTNSRVAFADQTTGQIENVVNQDQFTFDLSHVGTDADTDTVDYSGTLTSVNNDNISVRVELDEAQANQYVLVDSDADGASGGFFAGGAGDLTEAGDRVDVLTSVEKIVASTGESVLDLTASTKGLEVAYQSLDVANRVAALDRDVYNVMISDATSSVPLTRNYVEYRDAGLLAATATVPNQVMAAWTRVEGSDYADRIVLNSAHSDVSDTFNLRGGDNEVKYNELTRSITATLSVSDYVATNVDGADNVFGTADDTGLITAVVNFQDGTGAGVTGPLLNATTDTITSYTANNAVANVAGNVGGSLKIAASQDAEDTLQFAGLGDKLFLISEVGTTDNQITIKIGSGAAENSVVLTGFELVSDAASNDIYEFGSLLNAAAGLDFIDNVANDHDTVRVTNDATNVAFGGTPTSISMAGINAAVTIAPATFDFDVLDVTNVTDAAVTTLNGEVLQISDEVVLGALNGVTTINDFEAVVLTDATVTGQGTSYTLDTTANSLLAGAKTLQFNNNMNTLSFGGISMETTYGDNTALNVATGVTVTTVGNEAVTLIGGNGADTLTGLGGADIFIGGQGNDVLDGSRVAAVGEIATLTLGGGAAVLSGGETLTLDDTLGGATTLVISASGGAGEIKTASATADADQIGALLMAQTNTYLETQMGYAAGSIASKSYDAASNEFVITFTVAAGNVSDLTAAVSAGTMTAVPVITAGTAAVESLDTYVFEATAALNGVDTINNFNAANAATDDILDFSAFNAVAANSDAAGAVDAAAADMTLAGGENVGVFFNDAVLTSADIQTAATATAAFGEVILADNAKAVVLTTADADGVADVVSNEAYNVYFVQDTDTTVAQNFEVTLVGVVNSAAELNAADLFAGTDAFA